MALRKFEQDLLAAYKKYLTKLESLSKCLIRKRGDTRKYSEVCNFFSGDKQFRVLVCVINLISLFLQQEVQLGAVAVKCMAELLVTHPYFNFSTNLAHFLVTFLDNNTPAVRDISKDAIKRIFKEDKRGDISLEVSGFILLLYFLS